MDRKAAQVANYTALCELFCVEDEDKSAVVSQMEKTLTRARTTIVELKISRSLVLLEKNPVRLQSFMKTMRSAIETYELKEVQSALHAAMTAGIDWQ